MGPNLWYLGGIPVDFWFANVAGLEPAHAGFDGSDVEGDVDHASSFDHEFEEADPVDDDDAHAGHEELNMLV
jgi:hypothetical protein